jgi:hypothetical protein
MSIPAPGWDTILEQRAESERDHFFPVADEDATFPAGEPTTPLTDWDW